ncbi:MAG: hypothetical protein J0L82_12385 [Deltaproteobacteria bacterium]|nr:hypothetical protein [Deltaproteobacteria bacterium]
MWTILKLVCGCTALATLAGCATTTKSVMLGAGTGAAAGAGIGALVDPGPKGRGRIKNAYVGAAAGAVLGGAAGYLMHETTVAKESAAFEKGKTDGFFKAAQAGGNGNPPNLVPAKVEVRFVDDQVKGNIFVPAHFEYIILEPARWSN